MFIAKAEASAYPRSNGKNGVGAAAEAKAYLERGQCGGEMVIYAVEDRSGVRRDPCQE